MDFWQKSYVGKNKSKHLGYIYNQNVLIMLSKLGQMNLRLFQKSTLENSRSKWCFDWMIGNKIAQTITNVSVNYLKNSSEIVESETEINK